MLFQQMFYGTLILLILGIFCCLPCHDHNIITLTNVFPVKTYNLPNHSRHSVSYDTVSNFFTDGNSNSVIWQPVLKYNHNKATIHLR